MSAELFLGVALISLSPSAFQFSIRIRSLLIWHAGRFGPRQTAFVDEREDRECLLADAVTHRGLSRVSRSREPSEPAHIPRIIRQEPLVDVFCDMSGAL